MIQFGIAGMMIGLLILTVVYQVEQKSWRHDVTMLINDQTAMLNELDQDVGSCWGGTPHE